LYTPAASPSKILNAVVRAWHIPLIMNWCILTWLSNLYRMQARLLVN
jgi:hypothetical protein